MSRGLIVTVAIVILAIGGMVLSNKNQSEPSQPKLTFATVQQDIAADAKLYDVRTVEEFNYNWFENALNWPVEKIAKGEMPAVDKNTKVYVYCRSGNRSAQAASLLKSSGFTDVIDLGGLADVEAMGGKLLSKEDL